jgi:hypothetical protein
MWWRFLIAALLLVALIAGWKVMAINAEYERNLHEHHRKSSVRTAACDETVRSPTIDRL